MQESLFNFGKEKRQIVQVNNTRDAHWKQEMGLLLGLFKNPPNPINKNYLSQTDFLVFYFSQKVMLTDIVSYRYFNSEFYIEGVCSDIPLVRLVQKGLFNFGKEKRHDILVNNLRDAHWKKRNGIVTRVVQESTPPNQ